MRSVLDLAAIIFLFTLSNINPSACIDWQATFHPTKTSIEIDGTERIHLILSNLTAETIDTINANFVIRTQDEKVAVVEQPGEIRFDHLANEGGSWETYFDLKGVFLGE